MRCARFSWQNDPGLRDFLTARWRVCVGELESARHLIGGVTGDDEQLRSVY
jgi:hypothetical protein